MSVSLLAVLICITPLEVHEYDSGNTQVVPVYQKECALVDFDDAKDVANYLLTRKSVKGTPNPYIKPDESPTQ